MYAILQRFQSDLIETKGYLFCYDDEGRSLLNLATIEPPDLFNETRLSCIPIGKYLVKKRWSWKHGFHFEICAVHNRSLILIHSGNYYNQTLGCVIVGSSFADINHNDVIDVVNSKASLKKLYNLMPKSFYLEITL